MASQKKEADAGQAEVQKKVDKGEEQGFLGRKVDPRPNSDYSLESGPDAPPLVPDGRSRVEQIHVADPED